MLDAQGVCHLLRSPSTIPNEAALVGFKILCVGALPGEVISARITKTRKGNPSSIVPDFVLLTAGLSTGSWLCLMLQHIFCHNYSIAALQAGDCRQPLCSMSVQA